MADQPKTPCGVCLIIRKFREEPLAPGESLETRFSVSYMCGFTDMMGAAAGKLDVCFCKFHKQMFDSAVAALNEHAGTNVRSFDITPEDGKDPN